MKKSSLFAFAFISLCFQKSEDIDTLIQKEYNKIEFVSEQLKENLAYLKTNESTDKSIIHIGDSHVQIGSLYQGIKETLKSKNININEGWFYPAGLQKDYYHPFFNVTNQSNPFIVESIKAKEPQFEVGITGRTFRMSAEKNVISCSSIRSINKIEFLHKNSKEIKIVFGKRLRFNCKAQVDTKEQRFEALKAEFERMMAAGELKSVANNVEITMTSEGLRINIFDRDGEAMFVPGGSEPTARLKLILGVVAQVLGTVKNAVILSGHTDAAAMQRGTYSNWELSADRANAVRRSLGAAGLTQDRLLRVEGKAAVDLLMPQAPLDPRNRRIAVTILRSEVEQQLRATR